MNQNIIDQETEILRYAIDDPGVWRVSTMAAKLKLPQTTIKIRLIHLRASGYLVRSVRKITATDEGRVAYFKRRSQDGKKRD